MQAPAVRKKRVVRIGRIRPRKGGGEGGELLSGVFSLLLGAVFGGMSVTVVLYLGTGLVLLSSSEGRVPQVPPAMAGRQIGRAPGGN